MVSVISVTCSRIDLNVYLGDLFSLDLAGQPVVVINSIRTCSDLLGMSSQYLARMARLTP